MTGHRARGIGFIIPRIFSMRARTLRVVFAAKLLKKLISIHLVYLVLKLSPVPVPGQRRPEFCLCLCIKNLNLIPVGSCDLGSVGGKCHAADRIVDAQGRLARASRRLPYLDGFVPASTGYFCAVWRPRHGQDPVIPMSQHEATQAG